MITQSSIPILHQAIQHQDRLAVTDPHGQYRYAELLAAAEQVARVLLAEHAETDLNESRITFLVPAGMEYVAIQWGFGWPVASPCRCV